MSIELANESGVIGQFASNAGFSDLIKAVQDRSVLKEFFNNANAEGNAIPAIIGALQKFCKEASNPKFVDVVSTAHALIKLLKDQKLVYITNGTYGGNEEETSKFELEGEIAKVDIHQHLVFGWFSIVRINGQELTDTQGDIIHPSVIEMSAYKFVLTARKAGEMHTKGKDDIVTGVGRLIESCVFTAEKQRAMLSSLHQQGITDAVLDLRCDAWWGGFYVDNPETWEKVVSGELKAFSIGGRGKRDERP